MLKFLTELEQQGKNVVHLFCVRCSGQNSNQTILMMLAYAIEVLTNIKEVTSNFLVTGHSQNKNVSIHSIIKTATSQKKIFTTDQWQTAISMSFKKNTPYVEVFTNTNVYHFKDSSVMP